jgi:hypothetical protein
MSIPRIFIPWILDVKQHWLHLQLIPARSRRQCTITL